MIEGLYRINWQQLTHAGGAAGNVPGMLLSIGSPQKAERDLGFRLLGETLCRDGVVYEAAPHALPFLRQLLDDPAFEEKPRLLRFLAEIAGAEGPSCEKAADEAPCPEARWYRLARSAVAAGIPRTLHLLDHLDPEVRIRAAYLLSRFPTEGERIVPHLAERIDVERQIFALTSLTLAISDFDPWGEISLRRFRRIASGNYPDLCRLAALLGMLRQQKEKTPPIVLEGLLDLLSSLDPTLPAAYARLPWARAHLHADIAAALVGFGPAQAPKLLPDLLRVLDRVDEESALKIVDAILSLGFAGYENGRPLTETQRAALEAIAGSRALEALPEPLGRALDRLGLPATRNGLLSCLQVRQV